MSWSSFPQTNGRVLHTIERLPDNSDLHFEDLSVGPDGSVFFSVNLGKGCIASLQRRALDGGGGRPFQWD